MTELDPDSVDAAVLSLIARVHRVRPISAAKDLNLTRKRVDNAIRRLEERGLVFTQPNPHDGRSKVVCLTDTGHTDALALRLAQRPRPERALFPAALI